MVGRRQDSPWVVVALLAAFWLVPATLVSFQAAVPSPQVGSATELPAIEERATAWSSAPSRDNESLPAPDPFILSGPPSPVSQSPLQETVPAPVRTPPTTTPKPHQRRRLPPAYRRTDAPSAARDANAEADGETAPETTKVTSLASRAEDGGAAFSVRRIQRSEFPPASTLRKGKPRLHAASNRHNLLSGSENTGAGSFSLWDDLRVRLSGTVSRPAEGSPARQSDTRLALTKILSVGRLHFQADFVDREGRLFVARRSVGLETFGRWWLAAGDHAIPPGAAGLNGTQARTLILERRAPGTGSSARWRAGGLLGRLPLSYLNMERSVFPRNIAAVYGRIEQPNRFHFHGLLYSLSDREGFEVTSGPPIHRGIGIGLSSAIRNQRFNLRGQLHSSHLDLHQRDDGISVAANLSGGGQLGPFGLGARLQGTRGTPYEIDHHGGLQPTPGLIQEGNLSFRSRVGLIMNAWAGRWANPVISENSIEGPVIRQVSASGQLAGARGTWKIGKTGTAISFSREHRRRERDGDAQNTVSTGTSISQQIRRGIATSLRWNRISYSDRGSHNYVTGDLSFRLGRRLLVSLQQRTLWREPYGARLESILDVSGVRLLDGRLSLSSQMALTQDRSDAQEFRQSQWQSRFHADFHLSERFRLTSRYHMIHSDFGAVHNFHIGLAHSPNPTRSEPPGASGRILFERQLVRGHVFEDVNGDGKRQEGEPGIPGVEVAVDENTRQPLTCDVEGACRALILPGRHTVRVIPASVPTEYMLRGTGPIEIEVMHDRPTEFAFPLKRRIGAIYGRVVDDNTGEGLRDVKVLLGEHDFAFTGRNGAFRFVSLPAGEYELRMDARTLPFGYRPRQETRQVRVGGESSGEDLQILNAYRPIRRVEF